MSRTIRALVAPATSHETKGMLGKYTESVLAEVDVDKLRGSFEKLSGDIKEIFAGIDSTGGCKLKEIAVAVEISAEGGVTLVGTLTAGAKAAITLTFDRS